VIGDLGLPQCLQVPINGHQRHSEHLAELGLSEWQRTSVGFHEPGEFGGGVPPAITNVSDKPT
jgi:hypothetical protein